MFLGTVSYENGTSRCNLNPRWAACFNSSYLLGSLPQTGTQTADFIFVASNATVRSALLISLSSPILHLPTLGPAKSARNRREVVKKLPLEAKWAPTLMEENAEGKSGWSAEPKAIEPFSDAPLQVPNCHYHYQHRPCCRGSQTEDRMHRTLPANHTGLQVALIHFRPMTHTVTPV